MQFMTVMVMVVLIQLGLGFSQEIFPLSNYSNDDESMVTIVDFEPSPLGGAFVAGEYSKMMQC